MSSSTFSPLQLQLLVFLSILVIAFRSNGSDELTPTPWPERFNALLFTNHSLTGKITLQMNDLWYDWPNRRTMNRIQYQLGDYLRDVEWNNGTSYYFTSGPSGTCRTTLFPVGVLSPNWLSGATYLGRTFTDGFECHVYTKVDFIFYYEEVGTGRPVYWYFTEGMSMHVMTFEVGAVLEDSEWQAPEYCFADDANNNENLQGLEGKIDNLSDRKGAVSLFDYLHFRKFASM